MLSNPMSPLQMSLVFVNQCKQIANVAMTTYYHIHCEMSYRIAVYCHLNYNKNSDNNSEVISRIICCWCSQDTTLKGNDGYDTKPNIAI